MEHTTEPLAEAILSPDGCPSIRLRILAGPKGVRRIHIERRRGSGAGGQVRRPRPPVHGTDAGRCVLKARDELAAYFQGTLQAFSVPVDVGGEGSAFDRRVWEALRAIPFGATRTYGEVARAIGRPGAARAVGGACGRNPVAVVVPCHRVLGADGLLTGFTAGLPLKEILLSIEGRGAGASRRARRKETP